MKNSQIKARIKELISLNGDVYKLIDPQHPHYCYAGIKDGKRYVCFDVDELVFELSSTKLIEVMTQDKGKKQRIYFKLLNNDFEELFLNFSLDLVLSSKEVTSSELSGFISNRWQHWIELFSLEHAKNISNDVVKGILGELIFLQRYLFTKYGEIEGINSWQGPIKSAKDFEIMDTWYEVKSITTRSNCLKISSLEQLNDSREGSLVTVILDEANSVVEQTVELSEVITEIESYFIEKNNSDLLKKFQAAILSYGILGNNYEKRYYLIRNMTFYEVRDNFPRILKKDLGKGIGKVSYEVFLEGIQEFKGDVLNGDELI